MREFVGAGHRQAVVELLQAFDEIAGGAGPLAVSIEASIGLGKTRVIQEFYAGLAATRQGPAPYWPTRLDDLDDLDLLRARKRVYPPPFVAPGNVELPWLWWGISCHLSHLGAPLQSLQTAGRQFQVHTEALLAQLQRKGQRREDAAELLEGVFGVLGVINPVAPVEAIPKLLGHWRRRRQRSREEARGRMDRRVDPEEESYEAAREMAASLTEVAKAGVPIVLIVDDAQWADPGLVSLLRHVISGEPAPVLVVAAAWPEQLGVQAARGAETFGAWLQASAAAQPDRVRRRPLAPLGGEDLGQLVRAVAPRTPDTTVDGLAEIASGSPLVMHLLLDLDVVRRDYSADACIDLDPATLRGLPRDVLSIYQELWTQLPPSVQRALAAVSLQGLEFTPGWLDAVAAELGVHSELTEGLRRGAEVHGWIRPAGPGRSEFTERARHEIAFDNLPQLWNDLELERIAAAMVSFVIELKRDDGWPALDPDTRRGLLASHLDHHDKQGAGAPPDLAALADSMLQLSDLELDGARPEQAVALARQAVSAAERSRADEESLARYRTHLAEVLIAAGRHEEAAPLLEEAVPGAIETFGVDAPETQALLADLDEAHRWQDEVAGPSVAAAPKAPVPGSAPEPAEGPEKIGTGPGIDLAQYTSWASRPVPDLVSLAPSAVADLICEVVSAEGPVRAGRVYWLLLRASGAARLGRKIRASLDRGVQAAVRAGRLVSTVDNPDGKAEGSVLRLPTQPDTRLREIGERLVGDLPSGEIVALAQRVLEQRGLVSRSALKHELGRLYGWSRHTAGLDALLEAALPAGYGTDDEAAADQAVGAEADNPVRARAIRAGTADLYDEFVALGDRHGLGRRVWSKCVNHTAPANRRFMLTYFGPNDDGTVGIGYGEENFERFYNITADEVTSILGQNWADHDAATVRAFFARLDELLSGLVEREP